MVLDPFFGTGTTGAVAKKMGRKFIGIEREEEYINIARERISKVREISEEEKKLYSTPPKRSLPRIPFGRLIERGLLTPGTVLFDNRRRHSAKVRADGSLISANFRGSIHQVGAHVQNAPACNGWQFWNVEKGGELVSIDTYRQRLRAELH